MNRQIAGWVTHHWVKWVVLVVSLLVIGSMGALGRRVTEPGDIADTLRWAVDASEEHRVPALVEIMTERETDAAMGVAIDAINEYEPVLDGVYERPGAVVGALPERD